jgi:hypothetical protein
MGDDLRHEPLEVREATLVAVLVFGWPESSWRECDAPGLCTEQTGGVRISCLLLGTYREGCPVGVGGLGTLARIQCSVWLARSGSRSRVFVRPQLSLYVLPRSLGWGPSRDPS